MTKEMDPKNEESMLRSFSGNFSGLTGNAVQLAIIQVADLGIAEACATDTQHRGGSSHTGRSHLVYMTCAMSCGDNDDVQRYFLQVEGSELGSMTSLL